MKTIKYIAVICGVSLFLVSCNDNNPGSSTPIDSTNVNGTAPATYGGNDPAKDTASDVSHNNTNDTGTKANNVHNTPK